MKSLRAFLVVVCLVGSSSSAFANDVYVSSTGSDGNAVFFCNRHSPCASFATAFLSAGTEAVIHVIDQGAYGIVTITRGITIDGGGIGTTLSSDGQNISLAAQFIVNAGVNDVVTIQNFTLSGGGVASNAISVTSVGALRVENCNFTRYTGAAIDFRATGGLLQMEHVSLYDMQTGTGVFVQNARASLNDVSLTRLQTGVLSAGSSTVAATHSTADGNDSGFVAAYGPTAEIHLDDCLMTNNQWGLVVSSGATAYVNRSSLSNNFIMAMFNDGSGSLISYGNNQFASNASDGVFTSTASVK